MSDDQARDLVRRIERAVQCCESLQKNLSNGASSSPSTTSGSTEKSVDAEAIAQRLEAVLLRVQSIENTLGVPSTASIPQQQSHAQSPVPAVAGSSSPGTFLSPARKRDITFKVEGFEQLMSSYLIPFLQEAAILGENVANQGVAVGKAFQTQREMLRYVAQERPAPENPRLVRMMQDTAAALQAVDEFSQKVPQSSVHYMHVAMVAGGVSALTWVFVPDDPASVVNEMLNAIPTYGAKLQKGSEVDARFYEKFRGLLRGLFEFVRDRYPKGLCVYPTGEEEDEIAETGDSVRAFDALTAAPLDAFLQAATNCGDRPHTQARAVVHAFNAQREMLQAALICKTPTHSELTQLLEATSEAIANVEDLGFCSRDDPFYSHCTLVTGGIGALGWITVNVNPLITVTDVLNSLSVFSEKISKEGNRPDGSDEFVSTFQDLIRALHTYVKSVHPKGLTWNVLGISVKEYLDSHHK